MVICATAPAGDPAPLQRQLTELGARRGIDFEVRTFAGRGAHLLEVLRGAAHPIVVLMDAGRGHPAEAIADLLAALDAGSDLAIGSRYVAGGDDAGDHGLWRWLGRLSTRVLALPLSKVKDPTSGFLALRRAALDGVDALDSDGRGLGLELLVKGHAKHVVEVPIRVGQPAGGRAPFGVVTHVRRLYMHRFGVWSDFAHFAVVGASGMVVNLGCLTALVAAGVAERVALAAAIAISMFTNFLLNRRFTFAGARQQPFFRQMFGFFAASSLGALVNFGVADAANTHLLPDAPIQASAVLGILAGTALNFVVNRYLVFKVQRGGGAAAS